MVDHTTPLCPIPGLGHCIRERCNFWDEVKEECTADCFASPGPLDATDPPELDPACVISFYEDYD